MSVHLDKAIRLRETRRYDEAIAAIHQHLAGNPEDFAGYFQLAQTRMMKGEESLKALEDIAKAIALEPEIPEAHCLRSEILGKLDRDEQALESANRALALDPESVYGWFAKGQALIALRRLKEAEEAGLKCLELDPDDSDGSNLLSTALRLQGRHDEAQEVTEQELARDPENAWTFATAGWTALNQGNHKKAEELFREALRLEADLEHARLGLRESYKSRSFVYRLFLQWSFFLNRFSEKSQWIIVISLYVGFRFGRAVLETIHPLAAVPLIVVYLLFACGCWLANGLGHFILLRDPLARLTLNRSEKLDGLFVGTLFFGGLIVLVSGVTFLPLSCAFLGGAMMAAAIPGGLIFDNPSTKGRALFAFLSLVTLAGGTIIFWSGLGKEAGEVIIDDNNGLILALAVLAAVITTWIGAIPALREAPEK